MTPISYLEIFKALNSEAMLAVAALAALTLDLASLRRAEPVMRRRTIGTVAVSGSGLTLTNASRTSDSTFVVDVSVSSGATFGARDVTYSQSTAGGDHVDDDGPERRRARERGRARSGAFRGVHPGHPDRRDVQMDVHRRLHADHGEQGHEAFNRDAGRDTEA